MNLLLGKLYVNEELQNKAEESYTTALRQNPYALEAVLALTELATAKDASLDALASSWNVGENAQSKGKGISGLSTTKHEIERFYLESATTSKEECCGLSHLDATWMQTLVVAHMDAKRSNYRSKLLIYVALLELLCL